MQWTNETISEFLILYENEPALWNSKSSEHKNRNDQHDSWVRIQTKLKDDTIPIKDIKNKRDTLMATYRKLRSKISEFTKSGSGTGDIYKPEWPFYNDMSKFLDVVYIPRKTKNFVNPEDKEETEDHHRENNNSENDVTKQDDKEGESQFKTPINLPKRPKRSETENKMDEAYDCLKQMTQKLQTPQDECSLYTQSLCKKLRGLKENTREIAMLEIDRLIFNLKQNEILTSNPYAEVPPIPQAFNFGQSHQFPHFRGSGYNSTPSPQQSPNYHPSPSSQQSTGHNSTPYPQQSPNYHPSPSSQQSTGYNSTPSPQQSPNYHPYPSSQQSTGNNSTPSPQQSPNYHPSPSSQQSTGNNSTPSPQQSPNYHPSPSSQQSTDYNSTPSPQQSPNYHPSPSPQQSPNYHPSPSSQQSTGYNSTPYPQQSPNYHPSPSSEQSTGYNSTPSPQQSPNYHPSPSSQQSTGNNSTPSPQQSPNYHPSPSSQQSTDYNSTPSPQQSPNYHPSPSSQQSTGYNLSPSPNQSSSQQFSPQMSQTESLVVTSNNELTDFYEQESANYV